MATAKEKLMALEYYGFKSILDISTEKHLQDLY